MPNARWIPTPEERAYGVYDVESGLQRDIAAAIRAAEMDAREKALREGAERCNNIGCRDSDLPNTHETYNDGWEDGARACGEALAEMASCVCSASTEATFFEKVAHPVCHRHELKTHPEPFHAILANIKTFEYRLDDRNYKVGDFLFLREWDPKKERYTGNSELVRVTYKAAGVFGIPEGYCVLSFVRHPYIEPSVDAALVEVARLRDVLSKIEKRADSAAFLGTDMKKQMAFIRDEARKMLLEGR